MKLWLDDERDPRNAKIQFDFGAVGDETWVKTVDEAIRHLRTGMVTSISLDHDLGTTQTGYDLAKWIEEEAFYKRLPKLEWCVHSMNSVGAKNIQRAMINAERYWSN